MNYLKVRCKILTMSGVWKWMKWHIKWKCTITDPSCSSCLLWPPPFPPHPPHPCLVAAGERSPLKAHLGWWSLVSLLTEPSLYACWVGPPHISHRKQGGGGGHKSLNAKDKLEEGPGQVDAVRGTCREDRNWSTKWITANKTVILQGRQESWSVPFKKSEDGYFNASSFVFDWKLC